MDDFEKFFVRFAALFGETWMQVPYAQGLKYIVALKSSKATKAKNQLKAESKYQFNIDTYNPAI